MIAAQRMPYLHCCWSLALLGMLGSGTVALAGTPQPPDWVLAAAHQTLPAYAPSTKAVVLDDEETVTVGPDGRAVRHERRVVRILRQQGREYASVVIPIDRDRKLRSLHIWSIAADGHPYTLRENEIAERGEQEYGILYNDLHLRVAQAPAADPGAVIAYEYEQTDRPYVQEYTWHFQEGIPALHTSFELDLPPDWKYSVATRKSSLITASEPAPGHHRWQADNVPGIDVANVPMTPSPWTMAARMVVRYSHEAQPEADARWTAIGDWYASLALPRAQATPELAAKAQALAAGQSDFTAKLDSIASYLQRNIRYVGIEIGIGGLQPHTADEIFRYHYGDCKDKVTLLRAMLESVGIHSTWVLVDTNRGYVDPQLPSIAGNHAITAVEIPAGYSNPRLQSVVTTSQGNRYLIFDPTDEWTPMGEIRPELQGGYGILSEGTHSQLILLPRLAPEDERTEQTIHARLQADGSLEASVTEHLFGHAANRSRVTFAEGSEQQQRDFMERRLRRHLSSVTLDKVAAEHPTDLAHPFQIDYSFRAPGYARSAGDLLLVRPGIVGSDTWPLPRETRAWPIDLGAIETRRDHVDLDLPPGYVVDELPEPVSLDTDFASYHSAVTAEGNTLHYTREYTVKQLELDATRYDDLRKFSERISYDESTTVVLKKAK